MRMIYFFALLFALLALVPSGAHLAELANKMSLNAAEYQVVQQIYRGWALFGIVVIGALAATLTLAIALRQHPTAVQAGAHRAPVYRRDPDRLLDVYVPS